MRPGQPIRDPFERIIEEAETAAEKGRWFERLFMAIARDVQDFQAADIWPWREWPDRLRLTGRDTGIDLVPCGVIQEGPEILIWLDQAAVRQEQAL